MLIVTAVGRLGGDAETKTTPGGKLVTNWSIAVNNPRDKQAPATWLRCALWGPRGEKLGKYLTKGSNVTVIGTLTTREHNGKTYFDVDVSEVALGGGEKKQDDAPPPRASRQRSITDDYADEKDPLPF